MPGGIDYSKWDKMDYGDSSDEDDEGKGSSVGEGDHAQAMVSGTTQPAGAGAAAGAGRPRVTRLDGPSRVTRDADGMITIDRTQPQALPMTSASATRVSQKQPQLIKRSQSNLHQRLTKNGGQFTDEATQSQIYWCQDRQEVIIHIEFDAGEIKSKDIQVIASGMVAYGERNAAVGGGDCNGKLRVTAKVDNGNGNTTKTLIEGELPHKIYLAEDEDGVEWEILTEADRKFVVVTLRKAVPMAGVVIWWDCILKHCPKIDLGGIEGRNKQSSNSSGDGMESAWEEAHRLFKEKVKAGTLHQQHKVDITEH